MTSGGSATVRIRPQQFHETAGIEDWRVVGEGACAHFRTGGSFAAGTRFAQAIGELPDLGDDHPDIWVLAVPEGNEACIGVAGPPGPATDQDLRVTIRRAPEAGPPPGGRRR